MENFKRIDSHWINPESPWNMIRGKYLFENPKILNKDSKENNLLSLTLNGVLNKDMDSGGGLRPDSYESYQIFDENDLVFKLIDLENVKTSRVGWVHERGLMSPVYIRLKPKEDKTNTRYFYYYFFDLYQRHIFNSIGSGIRSSLSGTNLLELLVPNPSHEEQNHIVKFLDNKTNKINELVKKIEQKIDLLKEQKKSLINEVVTKGVNPDVEMKDSGVEWIGDIPSHWDKNKLKRISENIGDGLHTTPKYVDSSEYYFINGNNLVEGKIKYFESTRCVSEEEFNKHFIQLNSKTILLSINGTIGNLSFYNNEKIILGKSSCYINLQKNINHNFIYYVLKSDSTNRYFTFELTGTTIFNLSLNSVRNTIIFLPPENEQQEIVEYLDQHTELIDRTISIEEKRIELLKEYKQSLISEVVTGKKRVV